MKTAKANRDEVRANTFTVCCTAEEKKRLSAEAHERGLSISALQRLINYEYFKRKGGTENA